MSFKEKNIVVSLVNFTLILAFYLIRLFQMFQNNTFEADKVFRLWGIIVFLAVIVTIGAIILTHILSSVISVWRTGEETEVDDLEDERDKLIDLKGTRITYTISSLGAFLAMLTFVFGQAPLVMFSLLIFFGVFAQIVGDIRRLTLYRSGV